MDENVSITALQAENQTLKEEVIRLRGVLFKYKKLQSNVKELSKIFNIDKEAQLKEGYLLRNEQN